MVEPPHVAKSHEVGDIHHVLQVIDSSSDGLLT